MMFGIENPEEALATAEHFYNEWCNGGLAQFFSNWFPGDAQLVPKALVIIGASEVATVVSSAIALMGPSGEWRDKGHKVLVDPSFGLGDMLEKLDKQIDDRALWKLIEDYELKLSEAEGGLGSEGKQ